MRRPVRSEARAIASRSSCVHHCTACGPYCTSNIGLAAAAATASTSAICASTGSGGRRKRWRISLARLRRQRGQHWLGWAVDQRIAVAHRDCEADAHADVAGGARHFGHLGWQIGHPLDAGVVHHDSAGAAERARATATPRPRDRDRPKAAARDSESRFPAACRPRRRAVAEVTRAWSWALASAGSAKSRLDGDLAASTAAMRSLSIWIV